MENPLISVIMGVFNANPVFLKHAIESILMQTYENLEFIICDDASENETLQWLEAYAARDSRIRIIRNETNLKLASTLNKCISVARGEFLARQDADDISDPTRLEKQLRFLQTHKEIDFVGSNCAEYNSHHGVCGQRFMPAFPQKTDFLFNSPFIHGSLMFRANCLNPDSCYCKSKWTNRTEDYELFMRLYASDKRGANLQENLYTYHYGIQQNHISMRYRWDEMILRYKGFQQMGLLPRGIPYVFKPVVLGMIPDPIVSHLRNSRNNMVLAC